MHRVIPVLSLIEEDLVKTTKFKSPNYIGDPINALKIFNAKEVDELLLQDIRATKTGRSPKIELIRDIVSEAFMPIAYGGGISNIGEIDQLFKNGVEKITLNSAAITDPNIVKLASDNYGSQSIVVSLDIKKNFFGHGYRVVSNSWINKFASGLLDTLSKFEDLGAGEIIVNSIENDGCMSGIDVELIKLCSDKLSIPLVYVGGVGCKGDIVKSMEAGASATGVGSFFVYKGARKAVLISYCNPTQ
jgi:imidazole glycerol-phosphate synthase subunit HisF